MGETGGKIIGIRLLPGAGSLIDLNASGKRFGNIQVRMFVQAEIAGKIQVMRP